MVFLPDNGQEVSTQLTPNCHAKATASFDLNDSTTVLFYAGQVPIWISLVDIGIIDVRLIESQTVGGVTLVSAVDSLFDVKFNAMGRDLYTVIFTGRIIDGSTTYQFPGMSLGSFSRTAETKLAVKSLRTPTYAAETR